MVATTAHRLRRAVAHAHRGRGVGKGLAHQVLHRRAGRRAAEAHVDNAGGIELCEAGVIHQPRADAAQGREGSDPLVLDELEHRLGIEATPAVHDLAPGDHGDEGGAVQARHVE